MTNKPLMFSVDSQLMGELGEKLVTKNYVALSELIKNAYDADATKVAVRLVRVGEGGKKGNKGEIHIVDNGTGLSLADVRAYWMRIATPHKVDKPTSEAYGRQRTGNKGIGRFACQKISRYLELVTTAKIGKDNFETTHVRFDWEDFKSGTNLTDVPCKHDVSHSKTGEKGFTLKLIDLKEQWTDRDFKMLQRQVALLSVQQEVRRRGYKEDPGLIIEIEAPEFSADIKRLDDDVIAAGWGTLRGKVQKSGQVFLNLNAKLIGKKEYELTDRHPDLAGVSFDISWVPIERDHFRNPNLMPQYLAELMQDYGGVRVYMDGFRVFPYGDAHDDWLGIDRDVAARRSTVKGAELHSLAKRLHVDPGRVLLSYPRHRNLFGKVYLSSHDESEFVVKMDREGLVENDTYLALNKVIRKSIDWMVLYFAAYKQKAAKTKTEAAVKEFRKAVNAPETEEKEQLVDKALELLSAGAVQAAAIATDSQNRKAVNQAKKLVQSRLIEAGEELAVLRAVASTGPLMFVFAHEVKGIIGSLDTHALRLEGLVSNLKGSQKKEVEDLSQSFRDTSNRFDQLSKLFGIFTAAQRREKKRFYLRKAADVIKEGFGFVTGSFGIDLDTTGIDEELRTPALREAEMYSILVNLLSNAMKAVLAADGDRIAIEAGRNNKFYIRVNDNGVGLNKKNWQEVFEPLVVDPEHKIYPKLSGRLGDKDLVALGRGSGLGLSIVKGIVESNGGSVSFVDAPAGWKTSVLVELP